MAYDVKAAYEKKKKEAASGAGSTTGTKKYNVEAAYISAKKEGAKASSLPTGEKKQSVVQGKPQITPNNAADILKQTATKDFEASMRFSASPASLDAIQRQQIMDEAVRQLKIRQGLDTAAKIAVDNSRKTTQPQIVADQQRKAAAVPYQTALKSYVDNVKMAYAADPNDNTKTDAKQVPLYLASELGAGFMSTLGGIYSGAAQTVGDIASGGKYSEITKYLADNPADRQALEIAYKSSPKDGGHIYDVILGKVADATGTTKEMVHQARRSLETDDLVQKNRDSFDVSSGFKSTAGNVAFTVGQQIPAMLLTAGGSGAAFDNAISQGIMAGSAYGQKLKENSQKYGFDIGGYVSAVAAGAIEALTENLDNFTPTMNSILKLTTFGDLAKTAIGEGLEEAVGYPIENIIDWLVLDGATKREGFGDPKKFSEIFDMGEWTRNFIDGTVVGGLMGAGGVIANIAGQRMNGTISAQEAAEKVSNVLQKNGIDLPAPDPMIATDAEADQYVRDAASALVAKTEAVKEQAAQQEQTAGSQPKKGAEVATEMGIGKHGAEAAEKAGITPENVGAFTAYWNAGHEGRSLESVWTSQGGLDEVSKKLAYNAGQQDAAEDGLDVREWTAYDGRQEATANGESILRQGGERYDGQSSGQPLQEMEAGTGRDQSGYVQTRPEESRVVGLEYSAEKVSSKQAGLEDGLEDDGIYLIKGGTSKDYRDAEAEAKRLGLEFVPFAGGDIHTLDAPDGARGCVANGKMYVRMDDPDFSGAQIARHEGCHELIRRGVIDVKNTLRAVADKYDESFVKRMASLYNAAYAGMGLTEAEIETEMVCDAIGQMNIFRVYGEIAQNGIDLADKVLPAIREEAAKGGGTRAGPEGAQYSKRPRNSLIGHTFGTYDQTASMANTELIRWAHRNDVQAGDQKITFYHDDAYLIEKFDSADLLYQIVEKISSKKIAQYQKEIDEYGRTGVVQSVPGGVGRVDSLDRSANSHRKKQSVSSSAQVGQRRKDSGVSGLGQGAAGGRDVARNRSGNLQGGGANQQAVIKVGVELDEKTESAAPGAYSRRTWLKSQYATDKAAAAKALSQQLDVSLEQAEQYIDNINSVAKMIADDEVRLDYEAAPGMSSFVGNSEYGGSIDFSTICKKRRLLTGTFEAIQKALPNTALTAEEVLTIRKMMADRGYEVSCGLCYVEGSRANMGQYTKQFLDEYARTNPKYLPNMAEMNTASGQEKIRIQHPEVYAAYEKFMNELAQRKPKMYQMATEYKGEILDKFMTKKGKPKWTVSRKNLHGGLRMQSFSDFEVIHLIDSMQVIMDMSQVGLAGQAYTKVPDFAAALGDTGLKINLSLIARGVDAKGNLVLDEVEGMPRADAEKLRNQYSDNVGTVIVVFTDVQLQAAMKDPFIDYIIPFHRSQWKSSQYEQMGIPVNAKDFTSWQNESYIEPVYSKSGKKQRPKNYAPNSYWDFSKSGKENAQKYLQMCHENNRRPKFHYLLDKNADGSYSLKKDGSTDGYWKLLIDFKMYNNEGVGVEQAPVKPEFNMTEAERMLREYQGGHETFPSARDVVDEFVESYKAEHEGPYSRRLNPEDVRAALDVYREQYGVIEPGENPFRTVQVPKKTSDTEKVSYTARTAMEAEATPADFVPLIESEIVKGGFSFVPVSNDETTKKAKGFILGEGWQSAWNKWSSDVKMGKADNETIAIGALLYNHAVNAGDYKAALDILTDYQVAVRNSARGLQAARILKKLSPDARLYMINKDIQKLVKELKLDEPIELPPSLVDQYMKAKTNREIDNAVGDIQEYVAAQIPSTGIDMWTALRYTNMLGNFKTQVRNVAGNVGMRLVSEVENAAALAVEKLAGGKLGRTRALFVDKQLRQLAKEDFANVRSEAMGETRYTLDNATASSFLKGVQDKKTVFKRDIKVFGKDVTLPKAFNVGLVPMEYYRKATNWAMNNAKFGDEGFTKSAYARALGEYLKANGVTAEQFGSEEWQQKHGDFLDKARQYAVARAQELTFRDHNAFSNAIASMGRKPTSGKWTKVLSEGIMPFRRTPANVLVRAEEYSPLGLINTAIKAAQLAKGKENVTGNDVVNSLAKTITGTGIFLVGMAMHNMGLLRGGDDEDEKVARMDDLMGHQTYALEIGGVSYTLDWLTPTAMPLFMGAQMNALIEDGGFELKDIYDAMITLADPMLQMSMLSGLNDTLDNIRYIQGNGPLQIALNAGIAYLTQGLTNSLMGQLDRTLKDVSEMTFTDSQGDLPTFLQKELGAASRKVPGWDYSQIPYIDAWGRTESNGSVPGRILKNFLNPGYVSEIGGGDLEDEILELYQLTGDGGVFPSTADKHFPVKGEEVYLNADEYVQYATKKGQLSYEIAEKIMKSSVYRGMSDEEKANAISDAYALANVIAKKSVSKYETEGWKEKAVAAKKIGIDYSKYLEVRLTVKDIESLKDKNGKSIDGSKSLQIMEAIYNIKGLNDKQRLQLFEDFGVGESYWKDTVPLNKAAVEAKLKNMR